MKTTARIFFTAAVCASLFGCARADEVQPLGAAELTSASADIERSPKAFYDGRDVYLFKGRWYYKEGDRWLSYAEEPPPLRERRDAIESKDPRRERVYPYEKQVDEDDPLNRR